jgi:putative endonuclease
MPRRSISVGGPAHNLGVQLRLRLASHLKNPMQNFSYVYILESDFAGEHFYVGLTDDLKARLAKHNAGEVPHTSKFRPWRIKTAVAFAEPDRATAFERYLKSGSGRAFAKKHL